MQGTCNESKQANKQKPTALKKSIMRQRSSKMPLHLSCASHLLLAMVVSLKSSLHSKEDYIGENCFICKQLLIQIASELGVEAGIYLPSQHWYPI